MVFLKQMLDKIGFKEQVFSCYSLPTQNSNRAYDVDVILESFIIGIWCEANRFLHTEITRADKALGYTFGWKHSPAQDAYKRYFSKFNSKTNLEVARHFFG